MKDARQRHYTPSCIATIRCPPTYICLPLLSLGVATTVYGTDNLPVKPKIARSMVMLNPAYANRTATGRMPVNSYGLGGQVSSIIPTTGDAATAFHCSYHEPNEAATASTRVETVHKDEYAVESR